MAGTYSVPVSEARGAVAIPSDIDATAVVIGYSSAGSGLSTSFGSGAAAVAARGYGDGVDCLCQIIEQKRSDGSSGNMIPAAMYTVPGSTAGAYGTLDDDAELGTAVVTTDATVHPYGTYEAQLKFMNNVVVGTTGGLLQWSLDGGRSWSTTTGLGTASTFTIPNSNVKFVFSPASADLTTLNTLINEIYTDLNAHVILTTGSVHGAADTADVVSDAEASDTATRIARVNALRAAYEAHRVKTSGGVHGSADNVHACTVGIAVDDSTALQLALELKRVINLHIVYTTSAVHGLADSTNTVTSSAPSMGTFLTGDIVSVPTTGPQPSSADVDAAFVALANSTADFRIVVCAFDLTASLFSHLSTGISALSNAGKEVTVLAQSRIPTTGEDDATWNASIAAAFPIGSKDNSAVILRTAYEFVTDAMTGRQYLRSDLAQFAAEVVRAPRSVMVCSPSDGAMQNVTLIDSTGATIGHDEGPRGASTGLSNDTLGNRFSCVERLASPARRETVYCTVPWTMYGANDRIRNLPTRRVCNAIKMAAREAAISQLGGKLAYNKTTRQLTRASVNAVHAVVFQAVSTPFKNDIENWADAAVDNGLVQVDPNVTVSGGNLLTFGVTVSPSMFGYTLSIPITLSIQQ